MNQTFLHKYAKTKPVAMCTSDVIAKYMLEQTNNKYAHQMGRNI